MVVVDMVLIAGSIESALVHVRARLTEGRENTTVITIIGDIREHV